MMVRSQPFARSSGRSRTSSSRATRKTANFWLGQKAGFDRSVIEEKYGGLKPCLHGSDAHMLDAVLRPAKDRYCWIRAQLSFTGLKQTLIEPDHRVSIGPVPPAGPSISETISTLNVNAAPWLETQQIALNDGLIAIVGPKGSGKTALADILARASGAPIQDESSFLLKAGPLLGAATANLVWKDGEQSTVRLDEIWDQRTRPTVRYLSQQFVDRLCTANGLGRELLDAIESVVFQAIGVEERLGAASFKNLRATRLEQVHRSRQSWLESIENLTKVVAQEDLNKTQIPTTQAQLKALVEKTNKQEKELKDLLPNNKRAEVEQLRRVTDEIESRNRRLQANSLNVAKLKDLAREYEDMRREIGDRFAEFRERYADTGIAEADWEVLAPHLASTDEVREVSDALRKKASTSAAEIREGQKVEASGLAASSLGELEKLKTQLTKEIGVENERTRRFNDLTRQVADARVQRESLETLLKHLGGAEERKRKAIANRRQGYASVFDTFVQERQVLEELYAPLRSQLAAEASVERRLELHVARKVDLQDWIRAGEELLDLRKSGPFQGRGSLARVAEDILGNAWRTGGAEEVASAMESFITQHMAELMKAKRQEVPLEELGRWLFSTAHVTLEYGLQYEGVDLAKLSPGMRGIVLLMLYLAIDRWDLRPLIVDQPEENLDPHSVYEELVRYFRAAKRRRQVIIVTHNPNLVVNADADQVIVAAAQRTDPKALPAICYQSGGLEDKSIREAVCQILEGGERAFLDRERRYALRRDRRTG